LEGWVSHGKGGIETVNWVQVFCLENGKVVGTWWPGYVMGVEWWGAKIQPSLERALRHDEVPGV